MPSIIPSYVYSLFAALIVGSIIVCTCSAAVSNVKNDASTQQLKNIDRYVAAQGLILISQTNANNMNVTQFLDIPYAIGNQRFWINLISDSNGARVESGFGVNVTAYGWLVDLPANVLASGSFVSGSGRAMLQCSYANGKATITLTCE